VGAGVEDDVDDEGPDGCDSGTRAETEQRVPQAKPERATASATWPGLINRIAAPAPSWPPDGDVAPLRQVLISKPSFV
jgi:hypothetical protein